MDIDVLVSEAGLRFEESLLSDGYNESLWLDYADEVQGDLVKSQFVLDRAVSKLPASTLLWNAYLQLPWNPEDLPKLLELYRRALVLNSSPALWTRYVQLAVQLFGESEGTTDSVREAFDSALFHVDPTYHSQIWKLYLPFADRVKGQVGSEIYARYFEVSEEPAQCLLKVAEYGEYELAKKLYSRLSATDVSSLLVTEYCDLLIDSEFCQDQYFEKVALEAAANYPDHSGDYHSQISRYYSGHNPERARHFFSLALTKANTVREVTSAFDAYTDFEEQLLESLQPAELNWRMDNLERFIDRRSLYLSDIKLKHNPELVDDWLARAEIYQNKDDKNGMLSTFVQAISSINPLQATGRPLSELWIRYADVYISQEDYATAGIIFSRAVKSQFRTADELADLHIAWTEMLLQTSDEDALTHIEDILTVPTSFKEIDYNDSSKLVQSRVFKSVKLWSFYVDLLRAMAEDNDSIYLKMDSAYSQLVKLRIVTLGMLLDYASFLQERNLWERSLAVYESGLRTFKPPRARYEIWNVYLTKLLARDPSLEKMRDLFDLCLTDDIPGDLAKLIYLLYSEFEHKNGSVVRSVRIIEQAIQHLTKSYENHAKSLSKEERNKIVDDKFDLYSLGLTKINNNLKDTNMARSLLTKSLEDAHLTIPNIVELSLRFVAFEVALKEFTRARALFKHATKLGNPASLVFSEVWAEWERFEVENGDEESFKEMLKWKRNVTKEFNSIAQDKTEINPMGFIKGADKSAPKEDAPLQNPDAIDLDMDM